MGLDIDEQLKDATDFLAFGHYQGVEKQASGRQPRRAAFWKAQHIPDM